MNQYKLRIIDEHECSCCASFQQLPASVMTPVEVKAEPEVAEKTPKPVSGSGQPCNGEETRSSRRRSRFHSVWTCVLCNTPQKNISHHMLATHKIVGDRRKELTRGCPRVVVETATGNVVKREEGSVDVDSLLAFDADAIDDDVTACDADLDDVASGSSSMSGNPKLSTLNDVISDVIGANGATSDSSDPDASQGTSLFAEDQEAAMDGKFML